MKTVALALGGGGARGLAHIAVMETLDDMGIRPVAIAGTSIGALLGAPYAAGMSGKEIRTHVTALARDRSGLFSKLLAARAGGSIGSLIASGLRSAALIDAEKFCAQFLPDRVPDDFSALQIPLTVIASDLYARREAAISSGPLRSAVAASMAIPGMSRPVMFEGRVMVDGGATNPLPFDRVRGLADIVIAVDVAGPPADRPHRHAEFARMLSRNHSGDGADHHRREAEAWRPRYRAASQCRHLPHARFPACQRDPARGRSGKGGIAGEALAPSRFVART